MLLPKEWSEAWRVVDEALRDLLGRAESTPKIRLIPTLIDTGATPYGVIDRPDLKKAPKAVSLAAAVVQRSATGQSIAGGVVTSEFRGGRLIIHTVTGLAATTRYDAVFVVME